MGALDLRAVRKGLAGALRTVTGLKAIYPFVVERVEATPAAYVAAGEPLEYNTRFGRGHARATLRVVVVAGRVDVAETQEIFDRLLSQLDATENVVSVKDALEADPTLGGACRTVNVDRADNLRAVTIAGVDYLAIDVVVVVDT